MKELVYLDTSILHSFLAQTNSGLPVTVDAEYQESSTTSSQSLHSKEMAQSMALEGSTGFVNVGIIKSPSGKFNFGQTKKETEQQGVALTQLEAGREIISKKLHDNALMEFEKYLEETSKLHILQCNQENIEIGKYVKMTQIPVNFDGDHDFFITEYARQFHFFHLGLLFLQRF